MGQAGNTDEKCPINWETFTGQVNERWQMTNQKSGEVVFKRVWMERWRNSMPPSALMHDSMHRI
jgi:hypothetical protein